MTNSDKGSEQSMEEIIASIRKMIAEEPQTATKPPSIIDQTPSSSCELIPPSSSLASFSSRHAPSAASSQAASSSFKQPKSSFQATEPASPFTEALFKSDSGAPERASAIADRIPKYRDADATASRDREFEDRRTVDPFTVDPFAPPPEKPAANRLFGRSDLGEQRQDFEFEPHNSFASALQGDTMQPGKAASNTPSLVNNGSEPGQHEANPDTSVGVDRAPDALRTAAHYVGVRRQDDALPPGTSVLDEGRERPGQRDFNDRGKADAASDTLLPSVSENDTDWLSKDAAGNPMQANESSEPLRQNRLGDGVLADTALDIAPANVPNEISDANSEPPVQIAAVDGAQSHENSASTEQRDFDATVYGNAVETETPKLSNAIVADDKSNDRDSPASRGEQEFAELAQILQAEHIVDDPEKTAEQISRSIGFVRIFSAKAEPALPLNSITGDGNNVAQPIESEQSAHADTPVFQGLDSADRPDTGLQSLDTDAGGIQNIPADAAQNFPVHGDGAIKKLDDDDAAKNAEDADRDTKAHATTFPAADRQTVSTAPEAVPGESSMEPSPLKDRALQPASAHIEAAMSDLIRPIIHRWLEDNMPGIVDTAIQRNNKSKDDSNQD